MAVDVGRGQVAQSKLQAALDAAGLAAGAIVGQSLDEATLEKEGQKYLDANFAGQTVHATVTKFNLDLSEDEQLVTLSAEASLPTTFMHLFGHHTMEVAARSEITREMTGLEVALVVDVTGSMKDPVSSSDSTQKIVALRTAATDLVNILFGDNETVDDLWVGVVPFSQSVNIGTNRSSWLSDYAYYTDQIYCSGPQGSATNRCPNPDPYWVGTARVSTRTDPITRVNQYMFSDSQALYAGHGWGGCGEERWESDRDVTDDPPSVEKWPTYFAADTAYNGVNNWRGPYNSSGDGSGNNLINTTYPNDRSANQGCPRQTLTTLTNSKSGLQTAVNNLVNPIGGTHITLGAAWGWRLLSPRWRGLWGGQMDSNNLPLDYDEPLSQKAMILMTDGENTAYTQYYTAYGMLAEGALGTTNDPNVAAETLNAKTLEICDAMKEEGVLIYTIVFGVGGGPTSPGKTMMKNCASRADYYFDSPSQASLQTAFRTIGDSLSKLRVSK